MLYQISCKNRDGESLILGSLTEENAFATAFELAAAYKQEPVEVIKVPRDFLAYIVAVKEEFLVCTMCNITNDCDSKDIYSPIPFCTVTMQEGFYQLDFCTPRLNGHADYVGNGYIIHSQGLPFGQRWHVYNQAQLCGVFDSLEKAKEYAIEHKAENFDEVFNYTQLGYLLSTTMKAD